MKISGIKKLLCVTLFLWTCLTSCGPGSQRIMDLSGEWRFATDADDRGIREKWFHTKLVGEILLPGSMTSNGIGDNISLQTPWTGQIVDSSYFKKPEYARYREPGNIKIPFWLQPLKYYRGAAWYQKLVHIPSSWKGEEIRLILERCHWQSRLWVDDREAGMQNSLGAPHWYDLTGLLTPGKHTLTLCVDNRIKDIDPGINSHSISDHTQTNWNGITGKMLLEAHPAVNIRNLQVFPDIGSKKILLKVKLFNRGEASVTAGLDFRVAGPTFPDNKHIEFEIKPGENLIETTLPMGDSVRLWNEFRPECYRLTALLTLPGSEMTDSCQTTFGMREIRVNGRQILVNGIPVFLRGTLECAIFPQTGYPPTGVEEWLRIFKICRAHGLNHMRFHSWCPPEAAFEAADRTGFYLHVECSSWANQSTSLGDGLPFDKYLYEESERMAEAYGNHPSFCMMACGNEPRGKNQQAFLTDFVTYWKSRDSRRIYTSGAGWPNLPANDYLSDPQPRIQHWGEGLASIINSRPPATDFDWSEYVNRFSQPMIGHEIGQWCVYPDFKEIAQYTGVVRAKNFEIFQETLKQNGMEQLADSFLLASGKLQALCYKADIEAALRTPGFAGFQLLDLHDFPGQGTALVGVLNPFWREKGYITPEAYSRFCNSTVPLARMKKRIFLNSENFQAIIEAAHFGEWPVTGCTPLWKISDSAGSVISESRLAQTDIPVGNGYQLGEISIPLRQVTSAQKLALEVKLGSFSNSWDFWVYPSKEQPVAGGGKIRIVQKPDETTLQYLRSGGTVLLTLKKGTLSAELGGNIPVGFSSIFWNTAWTKGQAPHTLGILCDPAHPAFSEFPTEYHSNWQWWDAMSHSGAIDLALFPAGIKPVVRVIDDWFTNRPLVLLFEAKVAKGKILVSGIDLVTDLSQRPEARQLLYSLRKYMASGDFNPAVEIDPALLLKLIRAEGSD